MFSVLYCGNTDPWIRHWNCIIMYRSWHVRHFIEGRCHGLQHGQWVSCPSRWSLNQHHIMSCCRVALSCCNVATSQRWVSTRPLDFLRMVYLKNQKPRAGRFDWLSAFESLESGCRIGGGGGGPIREMALPRLYRIARQRFIFGAFCFTISRDQIIWSLQSVNNI